MIRLRKNPFMRMLYKAPVRCGWYCKPIVSPEGAFTCIHVILVIKLTLF